MTIRVADLVQLSHLQIEVLAGAGGIGRQISWAHASDLPDPWNWLAGGELLMKNGRSLAKTAHGQVAFLSGLAAASVAALVIGRDPMTPHLTTRALARADELELPILQVPYWMSFIAVSRAVADASAQEQSRRLARIERIYASVQAQSAPASVETGDFVRRLATELGHRVHLVDTKTALPVLGSQPVREDLQLALRDALQRRSSQAPGVGHLPDRGRYSAVYVPVPFEEPTVLVATQSDSRGFDLSILQHAAGAAAIQLTHQTLRDDLAAQSSAAQLANLLGEENRGAQAANAMGDLDLDLSRASLVAIGSVSDEVLRRVVLGLRRRGVRHIVVAGRDVAWILLEEDSRNDVRRKDGDPDVGLLAEVAVRLGGDVALGVSAPVRNWMHLPEAAREARFALGIAARRGGGIARYGAGGRLPALRDPVAAQALVDDVLGPVLAYDHQHGTTLLPSLASFLVHRRSWSRTAAALHVHRQTVIYRMRRIEQLTGSDLTETADLAELWLAVTAHELLSGNPDMQSKRDRSPDSASAARDEGPSTLPEKVQLPRTRDPDAGQT